jgi:GNAT superfamily N-acetyltransferase
MIKVNTTLKQGNQSWKEATYEWISCACQESLTDEEFETINIEFKLDEVKRIADICIIRIPYDKNPRIRKLHKPKLDTEAKMDSYDTDLALIAEWLFYDNTAITAIIKKQLLRNDLYYIEKIYVEPEFRGTGFGTFILKKLYHIIRAHTREYNPVVMLIPSAVEYVTGSIEHATMTGRLEKWYRRNGFIPIEDNSSNIYLLKKCLGGFSHGKSKQR